MNRSENSQQHCIYHENKYRWKWNENHHNDVWTEYYWFTTLHAQCVREYSIYWQQKWTWITVHTNYIYINNAIKNKSIKLDSVTSKSTFFPSRWRNWVLLTCWLVEAPVTTFPSWTPSEKDSTVCWLTGYWLFILEMNKITGIWTACISFLRGFRQALLWLLPDPAAA